MIDWSPLRTALKRYRANATALPIWWRDDDAISETPALERLSQLSIDLELSVHLAIIPKLADQSLAPYIANRSHFIPTVHGWAHKNTAPEGSKKSEFGAPRDDAKSDLVHALSRMNELFGDRLMPLFVPPWNRMDMDIAPKLALLGYSGFSTFGPRNTLSRISQINTHIDPIFWRGHRGLVDPDTLIKQAAGILDARVEGEQDATEPLGFLTHHLVHNSEIWEFSDAFLREMLEGGAIPANIRKILE